MDFTKQGINTAYTDDIQFAAYLFSVLYAEDEWVIPSTPGTISFPDSQAKLQKKFREAKKDGRMKGYRGIITGVAPDYIVVTNGLTTKMGYLTIHEYIDTVDSYIPLQVNTKPEDFSNVSNNLEWLSSLNTPNPLRFYLYLGSSQTEEKELSLSLEPAFKNNTVLISSIMLKTVMFLDKDKGLHTIKEEDIAKLMQLMNSDSPENWDLFQMVASSYQLKSFITELVVIIYESPMHVTSKKTFIFNNFFKQVPLLYYLFIQGDLRGFYKKTSRSSVELKTLHTLLKALRALEIDIDIDLFMDRFVSLSDNTVKVNPKWGYLKILEVINVLRQGGIKISNQQFMDLFISQTGGSLEATSTLENRYIEQKELLTEFADYAQKRMWEDNDLDLSEFVDEFLNQTES